MEDFLQRRTYHDCFSQVDRFLESVRDNSVIYADAELAGVLAERLRDRPSVLVRSHPWLRAGEACAVAPPFPPDQEPYYAGIQRFWYSHLEILPGGFSRA